MGCNTRVLVFQGPYMKLHEVKKRTEKPQNIE
jgi:hypothetical protein